MENMLPEQENKAKNPSLSRLERLKARFRLIRDIRTFFEGKGLIEVDCPLASRTRLVEPYIELVSIWMNGEKGWLYPSPEIGMKKLLSQGLGDLFQISHVFRDGEYGSKHHPEFTMLEWYRIDMSFQEIIQETLDLIFFLCNKLPYRMYTYAELFEKNFEINPHTCSRDCLLQLFQRKDLNPYPSLLEGSKAEMLNFLMGLHLEKTFPHDQLTIVTEYPAEQTLMSSLKEINGHQVAIRFEIYLGDLELANGSKEEINPSRQIEEIRAKHHEYVERTGEKIPLDISFLEALEKGIPECCGVSMGIDRLCMLNMGSSSIEDILVFPY